MQFPQLRFAFPFVCVYVERLIICNQRNINALQGRQSGDVPKFRQLSFSIILILFVVNFLFVISTHTHAHTHTLKHIALMP